MSCVSLSFKLFFIGDSIGYVIHLAVLEDYDCNLKDNFYYIDPMTRHVEDNLAFYPILISIFNCNTCVFICYKFIILNYMSVQFNL